MPSLPLPKVFRKYKTAGNASAFPAKITYPAAHRRPVLVNYAAAKLLQIQGGGEALNNAREFMADYERAVREMRAAHASANAQNIRVVHPSLNTGLPGGSPSVPWLL